jgi:beta-N-acetylhexosaminidase
VVLAIKAGDDMILGASGVGEMTADFAALKQALKDGTLTKERIDESVTRILALKMQYHLMPAVPPQT